MCYSLRCDKEYIRFPVMILHSRTRPNAKKSIMKLLSASSILLAKTREIENDFTKHLKEMFVYILTHLSRKICFSESSKSVNI